MRIIVLEEDIGSGESILEGRGREASAAFGEPYVSINEPGIPVDGCLGGHGEEVLDLAAK
jgi:hypothetical protein